MLPPEDADDHGSHEDILPDCAAERKIQKKLSYVLSTTASSVSKIEYDIPQRRPVHSHFQRSV
jgi:hypothetical protein